MLEDCTVQNAIIDQLREENGKLRRHLDRIVKTEFIGTAHYIANIALKGIEAVSEDSYLECNISKEDYTDACRGLGKKM